MAISLTESGPETNLIQLRQDFAAGLMVGFLALPICIAAGVLTASPLGTETVAEGAMAGLYGGLIAGIVAAMYPTVVIPADPGWRWRVQLRRASVIDFLDRRRSPPRY